MLATSCARKEVSASFQILKFRWTHTCLRRAGRSLEDAGDASSLLTKISCEGTRPASASTCFGRSVASLADVDVGDATMSISGPACRADDQKRPAVLNSS